MALERRCLAKAIWEYVGDYRKEHQLLIYWLLHAQALDLYLNILQDLWLTITDSLEIRYEKQVESFTVSELKGTKIAIAKLVLLEFFVQNLNCLRQKQKA